LGWRYFWKRDSNGKHFIAKFFCQGLRQRLRLQQRPHVWRSKQYAYTRCSQRPLWNVSNGSLFKTEPLVMVRPHITGMWKTANNYMNNINIGDYVYFMKILRWKRNPRYGLLRS
jgi:hypothetical protein